MVLRSAVQNVVMQHQWRYGYRRVAAELRARGMIVNHKRIARMMREDMLQLLPDILRIRWPSWGGDRDAHAPGVCPHHR